MTRGLVLGKFYPLHIGHIGLIEFAIKNCDEVIILICAADTEDYSGEIRSGWIYSFFKHSKVILKVLNYSETTLPNTSVSSKEVSKVWAAKITEILPKIDVIFSSEKYGDYLADYLGCKHLSYELDRATVDISSSQIRANPLKNWEYIATTAKPFFVKKICIYGTESTGKSMLAAKLANHYNTNFVPEMAREIIEETEECTENDLIKIAELHAEKIIQQLKNANKLLFVDTDINITRSYSKYLFNKELQTPKWVDEVNQFDLYLYLNNDSPYIQDGTRLDKEKRNELNLFHQNELNSRNINFELVTGDWNERFNQAILIIDKMFFNY